MAYALPVGNSSGGGRGILPPERPGTSNFCAISVKTKRQSHKNRAYSVQDKEKIVAMIEWCTEH